MTTEYSWQRWLLFPVWVMFAAIYYVSDYVFNASDNVLGWLER